MWRFSEKQVHEFFTGKKHQEIAETPDNYIREVTGKNYLIPGFPDNIPGFPGELIILFSGYVIVHQAKL